MREKIASFFGGLVAVVVCNVALKANQEKCPKTASLGIRTHQHLPLDEAFE
jgi:hypothetical protein